MYIVMALVGGVAVARVAARRALLRQRLEHVNRVLAALRNVNQLITTGKDPIRLLDEARRLLIETRGYHCAWVVRTDSDGTVHTHHAGFKGEFAAMAERLRSGELTACARKALETPGVYVVEDPARTCVDCPLSATHAGRSALTTRLEHHGRTCGWLTVSVPRAYAQDREEHGLLAEVAGDLSLALHMIETERPSSPWRSVNFRSGLDRTMEGRCLFGVRVRPCSAEAAPAFRPQGFRRGRRSGRGIRRRVGRLVD